MEIITRTCLHCHQPFTPTNPWNIKMGYCTYCSRKCYQASRSRRVERTCVWCGVKFYPRAYVAQRTPYKYCSHTCRGEALKGPTFKERSERSIAMGRMPYRNWRKAVLAQAGHACQNCGRTGCRFHAHHIQSWEHFPELRYEVSNGQALCLPCHRAMHGSESKDS